MDTDRNHFEIPVTAWPVFERKIAQLNKRAGKLGCEPITYKVVEVREVERTRTYKTFDGEHSKKYKVLANIVELHGAAPMVEGWQFIAKIEYLSDDKSTLFH